ncbi:protein-disulfide reductase DsbD N-terminal domain-containing protein [Pedobacter frigoris]|nr:protein-disulfide reductase DsbD N-terminal domain-containing protein [Pedobacter frigoris]
MKRILMNLGLMMLFVVLASGVSAQIQKPVKWSYAAKRTSSTTATLYLRAALDEGWHIYSTGQKDGGPQKTVFRFEPTKGYVLLGKLVEPKPKVRHEKVFDMDVQYFEKQVVFTQKIVLKAKQVLLKGTVEFMACTDTSCLPPDEVAFSIPVK